MLKYKFKKHLPQIEFFSKKPAVQMQYPPIQAAAVSLQRSSVLHCVFSGIFSTVSNHYYYLSNRINSKVTVSPYIPVLINILRLQIEK